MAVFDPDKYVDENQGQDFTAPEARYELYFSELAVGTDNKGNQSFGGKVTFVDGPRKGKYFFHTFGTKDYFGIYNADSDKRKQALTWMGNFFRAIGSGAVDIDTDSDQLINKPFIGEVYIDDYNGKKSNKLRPWGFHKVGGDDPLPKASTSKPSSSAGSSGSSGSDEIREHESDIPF